MDYRNSTDWDVVKVAVVPAALQRDVDVLHRAVELLQDRLPAGWGADVEAETRAGDQGVDVLVWLSSPAREPVLLVIECKGSLVSRDLPSTRAQLDRSRMSLPMSTIPVVISRYPSPSVRKQLETVGVSYIDATGNMLFTATTPPIFLRDRGADRDPWRGPGRPRGALEGTPVARAVRALVDFGPPLTVPDLIARSGASTGATYRVVEFLEKKALISRTTRGPIQEVRWRQLLERWSQDHGFQSSNSVTRYLQPRRLEAAMARLREVDVSGNVVTGSFAAKRWAPYAPARALMLYAEAPAVVARTTRPAPG